ncbi:hypothetical protein U1Q18_011596, partial [Sarracenia purpurea var. burkii]
MEEDCPVPTSTSSTRPKKSSIADEEIMELPWQNGQVVEQSQDQRSLRRSHIEDAAIPADCPFDRDFYSNLIYPTPCTPVAPSTSTAQIPDAQTSDATNILCEICGRGILSAVLELPSLLQAIKEDRTKTVNTKNSPAAVGTSSTAIGVRETAICELAVTSSPDASRASVSARAEPVHKPQTTEDRKRKGVEADDSECWSEILDGNKKKSPVQLARKYKHEAAHMVGKSSSACQ